MQMWICPTGPGCPATAATRNIPDSLQFCRTASGFPWHLAIPCQLAKEQRFPAQLCLSSCLRRGDVGWWETARGGILPCGW